MSLSKDLIEAWGRELFCVKSEPANYGAGNVVIFTITGGPVEIDAIIEYNDTVIGQATTTLIQVGAIAMQTAAVSIQAAANTMVVSPLSCGAAIAKVAPALVTQVPSLLAAAAAIKGIISAPATINVTFGGAAMAAADRYSLVVLYRKLTLHSLIS